MTSKFLNTPLGSWLKVGLSAFLGQIMVILTDPAQTLFCWQTAQNLGIIFATAVIPLIINWLNAADPRYGKNKQQ
jgi:hypothetical protein